MGQQQLLIIVLGIILVGIAIAVGISMFKAQSYDQKKNLLINQCIDLAALAQQYFLKPAEYGGGGNSYNNFSIPDELESTVNGTFQITSQSAVEIVILATGTEVVTGGDSVKVQVTIPAPPLRYQVLELN